MPAITSNVINSFICVSKFRLVNTKHISIFKCNHHFLYTGAEAPELGIEAEVLTCGIRAALVVPQRAEAAGARGERGAAGGGSERSPDRVVLEPAGLAAGAEVRIG